MALNLSDVETDGCSSGYFHPENGAEPLVEEESVENQGSKRKRESPSRDEIIVQRLSVSDSGRCHSSGSSSSSGSSDGSSGLEETLFSLDITEHKQATKDLKKKVEICGYQSLSTYSYQSMASSHDSSDEENKASDVRKEFDPLFDEKTDIFAQDEDGDTVLHLAIISNLEHKMTRLIISMMEKIQLNILNDMFQTPLHLAVLTASTAAVRALLQAGACVHLRDKKCRTPIHIACEMGHTEILEALLKHVPSCDYIDETLQTKFPTYFCQRPPAEILGLPDADGRSCIHVAVAIKNKAVAKLLLANGADVNHPDGKSGRTPLHLAIENDNIDMVRLLLQQTNIKVDQKARGDETALAIACHRKRVDIYKLLRDKGATENIKYLSKFGTVHAEITKRQKTS